VVIDPLIEFVDGRADSHKSQPVRQAIAALNQIAREQGCAILVVIHLNKGASTDPLIRHEASAAFTQVLRGTLMLGRDPEDPDGETGNQRALAVTSSNLAGEVPSLAYRIETRIVDGDTGETIETARIVCIGECAATGSDLLAGALDDDDRADQDEAARFLLAELAEGPVPAKQVKKEASAVGIGPWPLRRAKDKLKVKSDKLGMGGGWVWLLPEEEAKGRDADAASSPSSPSSPSDSHAVSGASEGVDFPEGDEDAVTASTPPLRGCVSHPDEPHPACRYCKALDGEGRS
jgi:putative DNA primase/helicase